MHQGARIGQRGDARALASGIPAALPQRWISLPLHNRSAIPLSAALPQRSARARAAASRRGHPWHALAQAPDRAEAPLISHALRSPCLVLPAGLEPAHGEETPKTHPRGAPSPRQHILDCRPGSNRLAREDTAKTPRAATPPQQYISRGPRRALSERSPRPPCLRPSSTTLDCPRPSSTVSDNLRPSSATAALTAPSNVSPGAAAAGAPSAVRPRPPPPASCPPVASPSLHRESTE